jgi:hypothetical protein
VNACFQLNILFYSVNNENERTIQRSQTADYRWAQPVQNMQQFLHGYILIEMCMLSLSLAWVFMFVLSVCRAELNDA